MRYPGDFSGARREPGGSAVHGFTITPSDSGAFAAPTSYIYVGYGSGTLGVEFASRAKVTLPGVMGGMLLPIQAFNVNSSGTSGVSGLIGLV